MGATVKSLRLLGILRLVTSCPSLAGWGKGQVERFPQLDEALSVKLLQHPNPPEWVLSFGNSRAAGQEEES